MSYSSPALAKRYQGGKPKRMRPITAVTFGVTCGDLIDCGNACTTQACLTACVKKGTTSAQSTYKALGDCIDKACPSATAVDGGNNPACALDSTGKLVDKTKCDKCVSDSQMTGGACKAALDACAADGA